MTDNTEDDQLKSGGTLMPGELYKAVADILAASGANHANVTAVLSHLLLNTMVAQRNYAGAMIEEDAMPHAIVTAMSACERFKLTLTEETNHINYARINEQLKAMTDGTDDLAETLKNPQHETNKDLN